jgi:hypothetical protein
LPAINSSPKSSPMMVVAIVGIVLSTVPHPSGSVRWIVA